MTSELELSWEEQDRLLCERYPKIFRDRHGDMRTTAMCWGFETDTGWYNIINQMCRLIQSHIDWSRKDRARGLRYNRAVTRALKGDLGGLIRYHTYGDSSSSRQYAEQYANKDVERGLQLREVKEACPQVVATQVKEKFGTLRFYYNGGDDVVHGIVSMAESMSAVTCERCGNPGKLSTGGWIKALCKKHRDDDDDSEEPNF